MSSAHVTLAHNRRTCPQSHQPQSPTARSSTSTCSSKSSCTRYRSRAGLARALLRPVSTIFPPVSRAAPHKFTVRHALSSCIPLSATHPKHPRATAETLCLLTMPLPCACAVLFTTAVTAFARWRTTRRSSRSPAVSAKITQPLPIHSRAGLHYRRL